MTVGFGIAPNLLTLPHRGEEGARGLKAPRPLTAGGDFHPALRTTAPIGAAPQICRTQPAAASHPPWAGCMAPTPGVMALPEPDPNPIPPAARLASRESISRTRTPRIRFRFVLNAQPSRCDDLWTSHPLPVDGVRVPLRGFGKSHHLILAHLSEVASFLHGARHAAMRQAQCLLSCRVRITTNNSKVETACPSSKARSSPETVRWK
jgi:hypothetical protein